MLYFEGRESFDDSFSPTSLSINKLQIRNNYLSINLTSNQ